MKLSDKTIQEIAELYNEFSADTRQVRLNEDWVYLQRNWRPLYKLCCERGRKLLEVLNEDPSEATLMEHIRSFAKWAPRTAGCLLDGHVYRIHEDLECPDISKKDRSEIKPGDIYWLKCFGKWTVGELIGDGIWNTLVISIPQQEIQEIGAKINFPE